MADAIEDTEGLVLIVGLAVGGYLLYKLWQNFNPNNPNNPVGAATNAVSSAIASTYEGLTFGAPINAVGEVANQAGAYLGPISSFPAATDSNGNTYLTIGGAVYQLGARNANGAYTAIPVTSSNAPAAASTGGTQSSYLNNGTAGTAGTGAT